MTTSSNDSLAALLGRYDRGAISRRQLLQMLGIAAAGAALPVDVFGQGSCGGARAGTAVCDTMPAKAPFDSTGWKTVYMDHFSVRAADYKREAAYYATLMNWRIRSDDGTKAILDIGDDVATVVIHGGYEPPPPAAPAPAPAADTGGGRGGGRGGRGNRAPRHVVWDSFCWGIQPWDAKKVEAELRKRGLNPVAENDKDFQSFHIKDPGGFDLQISDGSRRSRRPGTSGMPVASPPFEKTTWKTVWLDHISFQCPNYKESTAFYEALLGWTPTGDEGSQNEVMIGELGNIIIRGGSPAAVAARGGQVRRTTDIDHVAFGITPWDADEVKAELNKRGLTGREDTGGKGDIHTAAYQSYHTTTPDGFDLQISNATKATRKVR